MNRSQYNSILLVSILIGIFLLIAGSLIYFKKDNLAPQSTFDPNPAPTAKIYFTDPEVYNYIPYENDKFNFSIQVPEKWNSVEYDVPSGGLHIAFSPDPLPCKTCTYIRDGYFSVKIYNQKTSALDYADFADRINSIGKKKGYQPVALAGVKGVYFDNTVAVFNQGWIYELSLDHNKGQVKVDDAKVFLKIFSSFKFTGLIFN